jgi:hypothetical protein
LRHAPERSHIPADPGGTEQPYRGVCINTSSGLGFGHRMNLSGAWRDSPFRSMSVRKSMVPKARSIAGGLQIHAPTLR